MEHLLGREKAELVALCSLPSVNTLFVRELLSLYGSPAGAWDAVVRGIPSSIRGGQNSDRWHTWARQVEPEEYLHALSETGIKTVVIGEEGYPELLAQIFNPPWVVFYRGRLGEPGGCCVAVVGSRKASPYGIRAAELISCGLAQSGVCVVSGAAYGVDSAAHRGALREKGHTVAVLGCGPDVVYPQSNRSLIGEIERNGCIISEYPPGTRPLKHHFPARNRLIAGITLGVVVVEASQTSGALITAGIALSEGREVMAVPGQIFSKNSSGTNGLIMNGAMVVTSAMDVIEGLGLKIDYEISGQKEEEELLSPLEKRLMDALSSGVADIEEIAARSGAAIGHALSGLARLEVAGLVGRGQGGVYQVLSQSTRK